MREKVQWGVLGVANIVVKKVIPAMQRGQWSQVTAIASRDLEKAQRAKGKSHQAAVRALAYKWIRIIFRC